MSEGQGPGTGTVSCHTVSFEGWTRLAGLWTRDCETFCKKDQVADGVGLEGHATP